MSSRSGDSSLLDIKHLHSNIRHHLAMYVLELDYAKPVLSDILKLKLNKVSKEFLYTPIDFALPYERNSLTSNIKYDNIAQNGSTNSDDGDLDDLLAVWNSAFNSQSDDTEHSKSV